MTPAQIKKLRKRLGLSQPEFGEAIGLDARRENLKRTVYQWESGQAQPSGPVRKLMRYIETFGLLD